VHVVPGNLTGCKPDPRVKGLQIEVEDIVFNGLASSLARLTNHKKSWARLVIDLGRRDNRVRRLRQTAPSSKPASWPSARSRPNDLAYGLKVSLSAPNNSNSTMARPWSTRRSKAEPSN